MGKAAKKIDDVSEKELALAKETTKAIAKAELIGKGAAIAVQVPVALYLAQKGHIPQHPGKQSVKTFGEAAADFKKLLKNPNLSEIDKLKFKDAEKVYSKWSEALDPLIKEHKLAKKGLKLKVGGLNPYRLGDTFYPLTNTVNPITRDLSVTAHELGHAIDYKNRPLLKYLAYKGPQIATLAALPLAYLAGDQIKKAVPGTIDDKAVDFIRNYAPQLGLAAHAYGTLLPEGKASLIALKHLSKTLKNPVELMKAKKTLGLAFGIYLIGAIPIYLGLKWARDKYKKGMIKKGGFKTFDRELVPVLHDILKEASLVNPGLLWLLRNKGGRGALAVMARELGKQVGHTITQLPKLTYQLPYSKRFWGSAAIGAGTTLPLLYMKHGRPYAREMRHKLNLVKQEQIKDELSELGNSDSDKRQKVELQTGLYKKKLVDKHNEQQTEKERKWQALKGDVAKAVAAGLVAGVGYHYGKFILP